MATGPSHYREAEALVRTAQNWISGDWRPDSMTSADRLARKNSDIAVAQVHALLALTAAKALGGLGATDPEWQAAAGQPPQGGDSGE